MSLLELENLNKKILDKKHLNPLLYKNITKWRSISHNVSLTKINLNPFREPDNLKIK